MKCIALSPTRFEDLGTLAEPLAHSGYQVSYRHAGEAPLPTPATECRTNSDLTQAGY